MAPELITFEGLDGSGKSTHLRRAAEWLRAADIDVRVTQEPGGTELGRAIRDVFLDTRWTSMDGVVEALLVFAARRQNLCEVIEPALAAGSVVLCDRWTDSTRVYQGYARGLEPELLSAIDRVATGCRRPDRTLLFDLPAAQARGRGVSPARLAREGGADRLDRQQLEFYERVRAGYLELAGSEPQRITVIDSTGPKEATERQVRAALADLLE